ncbi:hypothetical protein A4H97_15460 [Niastella yeongjuensis]|uniref:Uncharacterized protein n=1 Tax=Niastella yeongjuensis TaxID=354355 RepID=A0A1V9E4H2_9BACT|nr:hypothetical protein [Niastella yeongjuensis]OQP40996.1 hypothetical protein A4H97_15460 [Niastella yeongjuensis]SEO95361.1 hypothetical protein SAMN05660816_03957 [Niastella yeongjuensis]
MKDNTNHIEVMMFSKTMAAKWSQSELVKWFTTSILPAIEHQEKNTKKLFAGILRNDAPIHLS